MASATGKVETSAQFARLRHWARDMAYMVTTRDNGYRQWKFKDGSVLTQYPSGALAAS